MVIEIATPYTFDARIWAMAAFYSKLYIPEVRSLGSALSVARNPALLGGQSTFPAIRSRLRSGEQTRAEARRHC
jgi:hypothetical protein